MMLLPVYVEPFTHIQWEAIHRMQIRRFHSQGAVPTPHTRNIRGVLIQVPEDRVKALNDEALRAWTDRMAGLPLLIDRPLQVEVMYFLADAAIDRHSAPHPILFLVIGGSGFVAVGEETEPVGPGDAVLWPAHVDHAAWTDGDSSGMQAIVINAPGERD
jgi:quercetin dioxygenase-like cupin family protein